MTRTAFVDVVVALMTISFVPVSVVAKIVLVGGRLLTPLITKNQARLIIVITCLLLQLSVSVIVLI